jgi:hypothetical protein
MTQLLITGTREGRHDVEGLLEAYVAVYGIPERVIVGDATGVDAQAAEFFRRAGFGWWVHVEPATGEWPAAGPQRNSRMVGMCKRGDHCIAFPHPDPAKRKGTNGCLAMARAAGLVWWSL